MASPDTLMSGVNYLIQQFNKLALPTDVDAMPIRAACENITSAVLGAPDSSTEVAHTTLNLPQSRPLAEFVCGQAAIWRRKGYWIY